MLILINAVANVLIAINSSLFLIAIFGSNNNKINQLNIFESISIRIGLATISSGALFNVLTLSSPAITEVILNIGLGILFSWATHFHYKYFIKKSIQDSVIKKPVKKAAKKKK